MLRSQFKYSSIRLGLRWITNVVLILSGACLIIGCATGRSQLVSGSDFHPGHNTPNLLPVVYSGIVVTSIFGEPRKNPDTHKQYGHKGLDLAAPKGSPVVATANGKVVESGENASYGNVIRLDHRNGFETLYAHLSRRYVQDGEWVKQGQQIGAVGATGRATGNHLHYEIRVNGTPVNPQCYMPRIPDVPDKTPRKVYTNRW